MCDFISLRSFVLGGIDGAMAALSLERSEDVAIVTLQCLEKRNALSIDLRVELAESFGSPRRPGGDRPHRRRPRLLLGDGRHPVRRRPRAQGAAGGDQRRFGFRAVGNCPKPVVAAVNGPALARLRARSGSATCALLGGGQLRLPGAAPGDPPSHAAARAALPALIAAELTLTGRLLDAFGAMRVGIVSAVHPAEELMPRAIELGGRIASGPRAAIAETKRRILLDRERSFGQLFAEEERALREALLGDDPDDTAA